MMLALATPTIPFSTPYVPAAIGSFPLHFGLSPVALGIILALVGILFAVVSVVLIYHWRRFPFEKEVFDRVEYIYLSVSSLLLAISIVSIFLSM